MDILEELEPSLELELEPQFRERSNTWPLRPNRVDDLQNSDGSPASVEEAVVGSVGVGAVVVKQERSITSSTSITTSLFTGGAAGADPLLGPVKKSGARRNAWGPMSYADLITRAILSSPDKRLTLSQIYDWMVQNVPYFKDKGDSTSSAGWKNSIRHNLSLHSRFMRIQNEGTGKSSWWVINPDAKPGKPPRRRAGSMDTHSGEKKRGRMNKKKREAIRAALENRGSPLNGSTDFLDTLNMGDFRSRASSNASSCSRLSPIPPDLHDNQVPPMSPIPWDGEVDVSAGTFQNVEPFPGLVNSLADSMNLSSQDGMDMSSSLNSDPYLSSSVTVKQEFSKSPQNFNSSLSDRLNEPSQFSHLPAPPPYPECTSPAQQTTPQSTPMITQEPQPIITGTELSNLLMDGFSKGNVNLEALRVLKRLNNQSQLSVNTQPQMVNTREGSQQNSPSPQSLASHLSPTMGQSSPQEERSPLSRQLSPQLQRALLTSPDRQANLSAKLQQQQQRNKSILRSALTHGSPIFNQPPSSSSSSSSTTSSTTQFILGLNPSAHNTANNSTNLNTNLVANQGLSPQQLQQQQQPQQLPQQLQLSSNTTSFLSQLNDPSMEPVVNVVNTQQGNNANNQGNPNNNVPIDIDMAESFLSIPASEIDLMKEELIRDGMDANFDNIPPLAL
ncbi:uncharacterized protein LOC143283348 [Babylonia areolata]|uniref:uncharacterized protein LOC143283348 n=1 Tax=Babylonia areolata TaxID=304850 RepID=UPI003FD19FBF